MRNADMPATPIVSGSGTAFNMGTKSDGSPLRTTGLTKREYFAVTMNHEADALTFDTKEALSNFLGRDVDITDADDLSSAVVQAEAKIRVMRADALLAELEKTNA